MKVLVTGGGASVRETKRDKNFCFGEEEKEDWRDVKI